MPKMIILQGPPACGKSTWRKNYLMRNPECRYTNLDEIRESFPEMHEHDRIKLMYNDFHNARLAGRDFIVDNTNLNLSTVERWQNLARQYGYEVEMKTFFDVPFAEAVERDLSRTGTVGASVIWKMYIDAGIMPQAERREAVIFDIDGTLANVEHRRHYVAMKPKNWTAFFAESIHDETNAGVHYMHSSFLRLGVQRPSILFVTGRDAGQRKLTQAWLDKNNLHHDLLLMRGFNDKRDDFTVKQEIYKTYIEPWFDVKVVFDDRDSVVKMWRELGLPCMQVNYGDF